MDMIKRYQEFIKESKSDIDSICKKYDIKNYTINVDGSIDVDDYVNLSYKSLYKLPLKFRNVSSNFNCNGNKLNSLEGCPEEVGEDFNCSDNNLTSLEGSPNRVGSKFICSNNNLTSFKGCPSYIGSIFYGNYNNIRDFYGFPDFWEGGLYIGNNPLSEIYRLFEKNNRCTELLNTTRTIVNGDSIRVEGMLDVADAMNIKLPEIWKQQIVSYKLID